MKASDSHLLLFTFFNFLRIITGLGCQHSFFENICFKTIFVHYIIVECLLSSDCAYHLLIFSRYFLWLSDFIVGQLFNCDH